MSATRKLDIGCKEMSSISARAANSPTAMQSARPGQLDGHSTNIEAGTVPNAGRKGLGELGEEIIYELINIL